MDALSVWWDADADAEANMAADEVLGIEAERLGRPLLRLYGWNGPIVSLGAFQRLEEAQSLPAIASSAIVRRPSGGGAIVHGSDLTYALAIPKSHPLGREPQPLYTAVHAPLVTALAEAGIAARMHAGRPDGDPAPFFCFSRRAVGDVVADGPGAAATATPKLMGSAQRRLAGAVVQHGSLLVAANTLVGADARHPGLSELGFSTSSHAIRTLAAQWLAGVAARLGLPIDRQPGGFAAAHATQIARRAERFRDPLWTGRR